VFVLRVCACAAFLFVMRVSVNDMGLDDGRYIAASLSVLTGLQELHLRGTGLCLLLLISAVWGYICCGYGDGLGLCEGGSVWVFVLRVCACAAVLFVMRVAGNSLGPLGGKFVAASLSVLTGLRTLDLTGMVLFLLLLWGWVGIV